MEPAQNIAFHPTAFRAVVDAEPATGTGDVAPARPPLSNDQLDERLREELETLRRWVTMSATTLAQDPILRVRHGDTLGDLNRVARTLHDISLVVASSDRLQAVDHVTMPELKARLLRRPVTLPFQTGPGSTA